MNQNTRQHTIFWADDDEDDRMLFGEVLEAYAPNHLLVAFTNGQELVDALQQTPTQDHPCLIVLDMNMPVCGGKEALTQIKALPGLARIPVVIFTTSGSPADKAFCISYQAEMVTKPTTFDQLQRVVSKFVDQCSDIRQAQHAA